jgi:hypothetical protein
MKSLFDWDSYYRGYLSANSFTYFPVVLERLAAPTEAEVQWLLEGLRDERRWFVAVNFERTARLHGAILRDERNWFEANYHQGPAFPEFFFRPLMDAGIDECEPSGCRPYVVPCSTVFGVRRALEYLYDVIEKGSDRRKVGALLALYYARFGWPAGTEKVCEETWVSLREREQEILLNTFLNAEDRLVRFAALRKLSLDLDRYPERLRPRAEEFLHAARESKDRLTQRLVRQRMETWPRTFMDTWPSGLTRERT